MVTVTGAAGHIGNTLVRHLIAKGESVRAFIQPMEDISALAGLNVELIFGDVRDSGSLRKAFEGADRVYHLAGIIAISSIKKKLIEDVNVLGTRNVVEACFATGVKRLVYVSSIHAFTEPPKGTAIVETKKFNPLKVLGLYAKTKAAATNEVFAAVERGLDAVIVHPTGVIGPYEFRLSNVGQLFVDFLNRRLFAYVKGAYDFVDVRDVADGIILAAEKGERGENYILSGERITVKDLLDTLQKVSGVKAPTMQIPRWFAMMTTPLASVYYKMRRQMPLYTSYSLKTLNSNSFTSHRKASEALGYEPRPIRESIADTAKWHMSHRRPLRRRKLASAAVKSF